MILFLINSLKLYLIHEIWFYYSHIALHKYFLFIHTVHHNQNYKLMDYSSTYIAHYLESPIQCIGFIMASWYLQNLSVILSTFVFLQIKGLLRHDNRFVFIIGNHHILHHKYNKFNYGEYWLDYLGGTLCPFENEHIKGFITL